MGDVVLEEEAQGARPGWHSSCAGVTPSYSLVVPLNWVCRSTAVSWTQWTIYKRKYKYALIRYNFFCIHCTFQQLSAKSQLNRFGRMCAVDGQTASRQLLLFSTISTICFATSLLSKDFPKACWQSGSEDSISNSITNYAIVFFLQFRLTWKETELINALNACLTTYRQRLL